MYQSKFSIAKLELYNKIYRQTMRITKCGQNLGISVPGQKSSCTFK